MGIIFCFSVILVQLWWSAQNITVCAKTSDWMENFGICSVDLRNIYGDYDMCSVTIFVKI